MGNVLGFVWFIIAYVVAQTSLMVWAALMLPGPVERARLRVETKPYASFFTGVLVWGLSVLITMSMVRAGGHPAVQILGWALAAPMLASSVIGGAAFARLAGTRLRAQMKSEAAVPALIGGALVTSLAGLMPVIGWFVFYPIVGFMSVGAGAVGLFGRRRAPQPEAQPVPMAYTSAPVASTSQFLVPGE
jgi:hypothetical protein